MDEQSVSGNWAGTLLAGETGGEATAGACAAAVAETIHRQTRPPKAMLRECHISLAPMDGTASKRTSARL
jgi:hypothetical protein